MASQGATMQAYLNDLIKNLEEMRDKKDSLKTQILEEEEEKIRIERELGILTDRLERIIEILAKKGEERVGLEKMIADTENTKAQLADSFKSLLTYLQKGNTFNGYGNTRTKRPQGAEDDY